MQQSYPILRGLKLATARQISPLVWALIAFGALAGLAIASSSTIWGTGVAGGYDPPWQNTVRNVYVSVNCDIGQGEPRANYGYAPGYPSMEPPVAPALDYYQPSNWTSGQSFGAEDGWYAFAAGCALAVPTEPGGPTIFGESSANLRVDRTPPSTPGLSVSPTGWTASNAIITIGGGSDNFSGIDHYQYSTDGITWQAYTGPVSRSSAGYVYGRAVDAAGNVSSAAPGYAYVDRMPPANPPAGSATGSGVVDNTWTASADPPVLTWPAATDPESGLKDYAVYWGTDPGGTSAAFQAGRTYDPGPAASGSIHYLRVAARDAVNNLAAWVTVFTYKYDGNLPAAIVSGAGLADTCDAAAWQTGARSVTYSVSDTGGSGLASQYARYGYSPSSCPAGSGTDFASGQMFSSDGTYRFEVSGTDGAGNTTTAVRFLRIDAAGPANPAAADPNGGSGGCAATSNGWQNSCDDPSFGWPGASDATSGVAGYEVVWSQAQASPPAASGEWTASPGYDPPAVASGETWYLWVRTRDNAGNTAAWDNLFVLKYDGIAPALAADGAGLVGDPAAAAWQNAAVSISYSAADSGGSGLASSTGRYAYAADGWPAGPATTGFSSGQAFAADGYYRFEIGAADGAGNTVTLHKYLRLDSTAPANATTVDPSCEAISGAWSACDNPDLTWAGASDATSGIAGYEYVWSQAQPGPPAGPGDWTAAAGYNPPAVNSGETWYLWVRTRDNAGNISAWGSLFVLKYDGIAPEVSVGGAGLADAGDAAGWQSQAGVVDYSITDGGGSGLAAGQARYSFSATGWPGDSTADFASGAAFGADGYYRFEFSGADGAGNVTCLTRWLKVDTTPPEVDVSGAGLGDTPEAAPWQNAARGVSYTLTDAVSGVGTGYARYARLDGTCPATSTLSFDSGQVFGADGCYRFEIGATDNAGTSAGVVRYLRVDASAPEAAVSGAGLVSDPALAMWQTGPVEVTYSLSERGPSGWAEALERYGYSSGGWPASSAIAFPSGHTFAQDGYYRVEIYGRDNAGNRAGQVRFFKQSVEPPGAPGPVAVAGSGCTAASGVWQNTCNAPRFTWAADALAGVNGYEVAWNQSAAPPTGGGAWTATGEYAPPPVSDGSWYLWLRVQDGLGRWGGWGNSYVLRYDHTAPGVTLTGAGLAAGPEDAAWQAGPLPVTCSTSDAASGMAGQYCRYSYRADGWPVGSSTSFQPGDSFSQSGYYRVAAGGTDAAGNAAAEQVRYLRIDATSPDLNLTSGVPLTWTRVATVTAAGVDAESGLVSVWCSGEGGVWTSGSAGCSRAFTHPGTFTYYGLDRVGNRAPASGTYTAAVAMIDDQAPAITLDVAAGANELGAQAAGNDVVVSWAVSDAGSGVASQELQLWSGAALVGTCSTPPACAFTSTLSGAGMLRAVAADRVGNRGSAERAIEVQARMATAYLPMIGNNWAGQPGDPYPDLVVTEVRVQGSTVQVTIKNQGGAPVTTSFWVDLYVDPDPPPAGVNDIWSDGRSQHGIVWGVDGSAALPLEPGESLSLARDDAFHFPGYSDMVWPVPPGAAIYVQADSASTLNAYGAVLEGHEAAGGPYNNILGPVPAEAGTASGQAQPAARTGTGHRGGGLPPR